MTLFKTVEISIQDIAVAMFVYQKAKDLGMGKILQFKNLIFLFI